MLYIRILLVLFLFLRINTIVLASNQDALIARIQKNGFPILCIETENGKIPTCEQAAPPSENWGGGSIKNATKVPGRIRIYDMTGLTYDSGAYDEDKSGMTLKIRGNTSAFSKKKSYKIELQHKADLLCRQNEIYSDKDWALLANVNLNTTVALWISELLNMQYTPSYRYVNVILNGEYHGFYILIESIKRNPQCRINVDKKNGVIFELDAYYWNEDVYAESSFPQPTEYTFKYPKNKKVTDDFLHDFQSLINNTERSLKGKNYEEYIDVESFLKWIMAHDILGTSDGIGSNEFFMKYNMNDDSKIIMPCLWDFDSAFQNDTVWSNPHNRGFFVELFKRDHFSKAYKALWNKEKDALFDELQVKIDSFYRSEEASRYNECLKSDTELWNEKYRSIDETVSFIKGYLENRKKWMDKNINSPSFIPPPSNGKTEYVVVICLFILLCFSFWWFKRNKKRNNE